MPSQREIMPGADPWSYAGHGEQARVGVLVVHGFGGNPVSTRPLGEALAREGFRVEVPRLPGHGTHWRDLAGTRYEDWRGRAERVLDDLEQRCDAVVLAGLSVGGTICLDIATRRCRDGRAQKLRGVATINAQVRDRQGVLAKLGPILRFLIPAVAPKMVGLTPNDIARGGDEKGYPVIPSQAGYSLTRQLPRLREQLPDLCVPALVIYSDQDHTVDPQNSMALIEILQDAGKEVEQLVLRRSYHVATLDYDAELLQSAIAKFARRVSET